MSEGDIVEWCSTELHRSTYTIVSIEGEFATLKQNFSIGTIIKKIPIQELKPFKTLTNL